MDDPNSPQSLPVCANKEEDQRFRSGVGCRDRFALLSWANQGYHWISCVLFCFEMVLLQGRLIVLLAFILAWSSVHCAALCAGEPPGGSGFERTALSSPPFPRQAPCRIVLRSAIPSIRCPPDFVSSDHPPDYRCGEQRVVSLRTGSIAK